jgi:predicted  nucleic acid-binding Zn-ribbon protein
LVPEKVTPKVDEEPGDDVGNLKEQVTGLKAELAKVRKQKSDSTDEASSLKERIANMEGQLKVLADGKTSATIEGKLAQLTDSEVTRNRVAWEDERTDARVEARLAAKDNDHVALQEANTRIAAADKMLNLYETEKDHRAERKVTSKQAEFDDRKEVESNLDNLFSSVYSEVPEMMNKDSEIWKAGLKEYQALPALMKRLGPLGELVAISSAIAKHPELVGKKVTQKVVANIEAAADKAFQKGGTAPTSTFKPVTTINSREDHQAFEAQVAAIKGG